MSQIIVYADSNFSGTNQTLNCGYYDVNQIATVGNDTISSLKVPAGWRVTLFENSGFQGRGKTFTSDAQYVGDDFNDITSSIIVGGSVTVYTDSNFSGENQTLVAGNYDTDKLATVGIDTISSLTVPEGWRVTLFEKSGFQGRSKTFTTDTPYIGDKFNDKTSAIKVEIEEFNW